MVLQAGNAQSGVDQLDQQALLVHAPVAASVAGHSSHRISRGQLTGQLGGFPGLHAVDTNPALLATGDLGGHVVGHAVAHQRSVLIGVEGVVKADGTLHAAVVQGGGQALVVGQNAGCKDGIGEGGFLIYEALIDLGVKREAAKSAGDRHISLPR